MKKSRYIDLVLISSSGVEFVIEIVMKFMYPSKYQQKNIIEILSIFELFKFFLRSRKLEINQFRKIFISERSYLCENCALTAKSANFEDLFEFEVDINKDLGINLIGNKDNNLSPKNEFQLNKCPFNEEYEEIYPRTKKTVKQISTLPIPEEMFLKNKNVEAENVKIWLGELIYIFRPILYCFSLLFFKYSSYKPYFISLFLDIFRMILQRNIRFHWKEERNEFAKRNYDLIFNYCFRNPIYNKLIKGKLLNPFLSKIFRNFIVFKKFLFWIAELRLSLCFLM